MTGVSLNQNLGEGNSFEKLWATEVKIRDIMKRRRWWRKEWLWWCFFEKQLPEKNDCSISRRDSSWSSEDHHEENNIMRDTKSGNRNLLQWVFTAEFMEKSKKTCIIRQSSREQHESRLTVRQTRPVFFSQENIVSQETKVCWVDRVSWVDGAISSSSSYFFRSSSKRNLMQSELHQQKNDDSRGCQEDVKRTRRTATGLTTFDSLVCSRPLCKTIQCISLKEKTIQKVDPTDLAIESKNAWQMNCKCFASMKVWSVWQTVTKSSLMYSSHWCRRWSCSPRSEPICIGNLVSLALFLIEKSKEIYSAFTTFFSRFFLDAYITSLIWKDWYKCKAFMPEMSKCRN